MPYITLALAVLAETIGTAALQASQQFTRPLPSLIVVIAYAAAFYLLSIVLRAMPVGLAYAMWSGLGIVFISVIGLVAFGQKLDLAALLGMGLIVAGILVIHLFSGASPH
ncbi:SMR family transporter [Salipiger mangrovisoli]|uniref:QacE family quaternary ammonium compound efflux SMR transporter n=1 Tax=Salipiger mangrovisoli TaxID=2865933 RepID=A0ABR9WW47_9RHOB|nr:SMR family transporter [Salipiger mangrovisoli]MBE9635460.1 QacE family quaternary ammonium compound efflux SMR transporter [Salipiger mangrovisoli]